MAETITFLFGAGASKGALHIDPCDPPLGNEVYDRLAQSYPNEWGPSSTLGQYSKGFRNDFEGTLFNEVCPRYPSLNILEWLCPMALYFSRFTPDNTCEDLYSKLLLCLRANGLIRNSIFGFLNYDCIFEKAAQRLGFKIDYSGGKTKDNAFPVLKIHGSCNFVTQDLESKLSYLSNQGYTESRMDYVPLAALEANLHRKLVGYCYPVISLYSFGKNTIVSGRQIQPDHSRFALHG